MSVQNVSYFLHLLVEAPWLIGGLLVRPKTPDDRKTAKSAGKHQNMQENTLIHGHCCLYYR